MTAKFLNNYPARNSLRIIRQNQKLGIVYSILQLLGIPLMTLSLMLEAYFSTVNAKNHTYYSYQYEPYLFIGCLCLGAATLLGMFCGIRAFEEEWNKSRVDMLYALPLNGKQRFFSDYAGGLVMYLIPYIIAVILGWIVLAVLIPMTIAVDSTPDEVGAFQKTTLYYFLATLGFLVLMWLYYSISALTAACCGTIFENIYTNLLLNILIPAVSAAVLSTVIDNVSGLEFLYSWDFIGFTSPIGGLIYMVYLITQKTFLFDSSLLMTSNYEAYAGTSSFSGLIPSYTRWLVCMILLSVIVMISAWKLYERRKAEQVSKPFVYSWIYYIILTAVTVCILCLAQVQSAVFAAVLFSAVVYFIMEVIRKRGFKKFWMSVVTYLVTVFLTFGLFTVTVKTRCFGRVNYVPSPALVTSAEVVFENMSNSSRYHLTFSDKDNIAKIIAFHEDYLQNHEAHGEDIRTLFNEYHYRLDYSSNGSESGYSYYDYGQEAYRSYYGVGYSEFSVTYHTVTGSDIHRGYDIYPEEYIHLIQICLNSDLYAEASGNLFRNRLLDDYQRYDEKSGIYQLPTRITLEINDSNGAMIQSMTVLYPESSLDSLVQAYQDDIANLSFDNYGKDEIICYVSRMPVYESCASTIALLKEWGMTEINQADVLLESLADAYSYDNALEIQIYAPENYCTSGGLYPACNFGRDNFRFKPETAYTDVLPISHNLDMQQLYPEFYELLSHARSRYISAEKCYLLVINGTNYLIPAEHSDSVQNIIRKGDNYLYNQIWQNN